MKHKCTCNTSAFGALKNVLTSLPVDLRVKGRIYSDLVLRILLFNSEAWCLREDLFNRLRSFRNRCVRSMCRNNGPHDETPHQILELARAPRRRFFRQLLQPPLTTLSRARRTHAHGSDAAQAFDWLG